MEIHAPAFANVDSAGGVPMKKRYYVQQYGSLYLKEPSVFGHLDDNIVFMVDRPSEVAFAIDCETGRVHTHGRKERVEKFVREYTTLFPDEPVISLSFTDDATADVLNRLLTDGAYAAEMATMMSVDILPQPSLPCKIEPLRA